MRPKPEPESRPTASLLRRFEAEFLRADRGAIALVGRGWRTVVELLASYAVVGQLYQPIVRLTQFQATALATQFSVERLYEIFDEPEPVRDRPGAVGIVRPRGAIVYRGASFAYATGGARILRDIDLRIEPGIRLGTVGPSGAGKSTLLALVPRLYDIPEGLDPDGRPWSSVCFDGRDVRDLRLADLRRSVALVPRQALLFEGSIRTNLLYVNPEATEDQMWEALRIADLATTVNSLPDGIDAPVGERGYSLSGGQCQRLALARAIVGRPAVFLLDDCTSALDSEAESRIQQGLEQGPPDRTFLIISHKAASVRRADPIIVLESGTIVEQGTHAEFPACGGRYAEIHHQQSSALIAAGY